MKLLHILTCFMGCVALGALIHKTMPTGRSLPALIPRSVLFGNPEKTSPQLSPDGSKLAYLAPWKDKLNIWMRDLSTTSLQDYVLTYDMGRGIHTYFWSPTGDQILYLQDTNGDENVKLYGVNLQSKEVRCYTPFDGVKVSQIELEKNIHDKILISLNKDSKQVFDLYELNLESGDLKKILSNPGNIIDFTVDHNFKPIAALAYGQSASRELLRYDNGVWTSVLTWSQDDSQSSGIIHVAADNKHLYLTDARDVNATRLVLFDPESKKITVISEDPRYDLTGVWFDDITHKPLAAVFLKDKISYQFLDAQAQEEFKKMEALSSGQLSIVDRDNDQKKYVLAFSKDTGPTTFYLYDRITGKGEKLFTTKPELEKYELAPMQPVTYRARDGLEIEGYLTVPQGIATEHLPLVLVVHGGPAARDIWGYNGEVQWLANRGYAVLQVNYRGSSGYGKSFQSAGDREWGGKMQDDLTDAIAWAISQGIADPKRIAIYGGSYGGYAALVGATFTPDLYCCAVDIVGISNLKTFLTTIPPYWEPYKESLYKKVGRPEETEFLESRSPLYKADALKIPLLIVQGAHDPRVNKAESEQFVEVLKEKGIPCSYMLFENEGHGLLQPDNRMKMYAQAEQFLQKTLKGRCEPVTVLDE